MTGKAKKVYLPFLKLNGMYIQREVSLSIEERDNTNFFYKKRLLSEFCNHRSEEQQILERAIEYLTFDLCFKTILAEENTSQRKFNIPSDSYQIYPMGFIMYNEYEDNVLINSEGNEVLRYSWRNYLGLNIEKDIIILIGQEFVRSYTFTGDIIKTNSDIKWVGSYENNRAVATLNEGGYCIVNKNFEIIHLIKDSEIIYHASTIEEGIFPIYTAKGCGIIDLNGKLLYEGEYDTISFSKDGFFVAKKKSKSFLLNSSFEVINCVAGYDDICIINSNRFKVLLGEHWGVVDLEGKEIVHVKYAMIEQSSNELLNVGFVKSRITREKLQKIYELWGVYSLAGDEICPPIYDSISDFYFGRAIVQFREKFAIIDSTGEEITKFKYDEILVADDGLYFVAKRNKKTVVILSNGKEFAEGNAIRYWV